MISDSDKQIITDLASRYEVERIFLFGSSASDREEARDIDLGVEGIPAKSFFEFYGRLLFAVSKPVDVIDLSRDTKFARLVRDEGIPIYG